MGAFESTPELFLREELEQKKLALEQERLGKSQFIKRLTLDIEKPIQQLAQFSNMSLMRIKRNELAVSKNYLAEMKLISEELLLYLKDMRELAVLKSGEEKFNLNEIDVKCFLSKVQKKFKPIAEGAKVSLSFYMESKGIYAIADSHKLMKVINIILSHAIHHVKEGGLVKVQVIDRDQLLLISIFYNGPTLDPSFFHLRPPSAQDDLVPGFNISVCKELMIGQKGDIELSSGGKEGNRFTLFLPLSKNF